MERLIVNDLTKTYANGLRALDAVSLDVPKGMFGLLGPNGAGKSTLLRTLATLQTADSGTVQFGAIDVLGKPERLRPLLGYLPQSFGLYPTISAERLLEHLAILKGITRSAERRERVAEVLQQTNLYHVRRQRLGGFSGGMQRRFGIAQALLARPKLLIVDEPTAGLDPEERNRFHALLSEVAAGSVVVYSTHLVADVHELCSRMAILAEGRIRYQGDSNVAVDALRGRVFRKHIAADQRGRYVHNYRVLSSKFIRGEMVLDVLSEAPPGNGFFTVAPSLEHVYSLHTNPDL